MKLQTNLAIAFCFLAAPAACAAPAFPGAQGWGKDAKGGATKFSASGYLNIKDYINALIPIS